jgi:hypothetical protein
MTGKLEERLPALFAVVPKQLSKRFPDFSQWSTYLHSLITAFDVHNTLRDIISMATPNIDSLPLVQSYDFSFLSNRKQTNRKNSLFQEISPNRTCSDAGIESHWCACMTWESLDVHYKPLRLLANFLQTQYPSLICFSEDSNNKTVSTTKQGMDSVHARS